MYVQCYCDNIITLNSSYTKILKSIKIYYEETFVSTKCINTSSLHHYQHGKKHR